MDEDLKSPYWPDAEGVVLIEDELAAIGEELEKCEVRAELRRGPVEVSNKPSHNCCLREELIELILGWQEPI